LVASIVLRKVVVVVRNSQIYLQIETSRLACRVHQEDAACNGATMADRRWMLA
jgi:hypothetical protein